MQAALHVDVARLAVRDLEVPAGGDRAGASRRRVFRESPRRRVATAAGRKRGYSEESEETRRGGAATGSADVVRGDGSRIERTARRPRWTLMTTSRSAAVTSFGLLIQTTSIFLTDCVQRAWSVSHQTASGAPSPFWWICVMLYLSLTRSMRLWRSPSTVTSLNRFPSAPQPRPLVCFSMSARRSRRCGSSKTPGTKRYLRSTSSSRTTPRPNFAAVDGSPLRRYV